MKHGAAESSLYVKAVKSPRHFSHLAVVPFAAATSVSFLAHISHQTLKNINCSAGSYSFTMSLIELSSVHRTHRKMRRFVIR